MANVDGLMAQYMMACGKTEKGAFASSPQPPPYILQSLFRYIDLDVQCHPYTESPFDETLD